MAERALAKLPSTTPRISWFEFLLDSTGNVLKNYITEKKPDPPPWSLCSLFLEKSNYQPSLGSQIPKELLNQVETRRGKQLRYLATVLCSYLRWNLDEMLENVSLSMQWILMSELRKSFGIPELTKEPETDFNSLPPQSVMAWSIYHRWIIKCITKLKHGENCKRTDLSGSNGKELSDDILMMKLQDISPLSLEILETIQSTNRDLEIPFPTPVIKDTARNLSSNGTEPKCGDQDEHDVEVHNTLVQNTSTHKETDGNRLKDVKPSIVFPEYKEVYVVPRAHMVSQISADLGMYYFYTNSLGAAYRKLHCLFSELQLERSIEHVVPIGKLKGFYCACASVSMLPITLPQQLIQKDLVSQLEESMRRDFEGLVEILIEDTLVKQIPIKFRIEAETRLHHQNRFEILLPVCILNCLRWFEENGVVPTEFLSYVEKLSVEELNLMKIHLKQIIGFLVEPEAGPKYDRRLIEIFFRAFLRYVGLPLRDIFSNDSGLKQYLHEDRTYGSKRRRTIDHDVPSLETNTLSASISMRLFENDVTPNEEKYAILKRQLSVTFDPDVLKGLIKEMRTLYPDEVSIAGFEYTDYEENLLEIQDPILHDLLHVIFSKSKHFSEQKEYRRTLSLLSNGLDALNQFVQQVNPSIHHAKVKNIIHHELLWSEISWEQTKESINADTVRRCKACYHHRNQDPWPKKHVFEQMVSFLLNTKEWQFLIDEGGSFERQIDHREIGYHLALLSNGIARAGDYVRRDIAPGLWNAFVRTITEHVIPPLLQQAPPGNIQQQPSWRSPPSLTRSDLVSFAKQIKEEIILSIIVSCLASMLNIAMKDSEREINTLYRQIWPTCFESSKPEPKEDQLVKVLRPIVDHMINLNPQNIAWIKNKADLDFYEGKYTDSMKRYLEIGAITTAFFSTPVHYNVWDDQFLCFLSTWSQVSFVCTNGNEALKHVRINSVYKRLIACCQQQNASTQVAVLCQFVNPVDYTTAFRVLKDGVSDDASDALYECFWDITILEFLVYMHNKRGEQDKKQLAVKIIGQPEINSCNSPDILKQSADLRKCKFLRILAKLYWR